VLVWFRITLTDIPCKNYNCIFVFVKVIPKTLLVPFFPDMVYVCSCLDLRKSDGGLLFIDKHLSQSLNHRLLKSEEGAVCDAKTRHEDDDLSVEMQASCKNKVTQKTLIRTGCDALRQRAVPYGAVPYCVRCLYLIRANI